MKCQVPWSDAHMTVRGTASPDTRREMATGPLRLQALVDAPFELAISGTVYPLGQRHTTTSVLRVDPDDVPALLAVDFAEDLRIRLVPDDLHPPLLVRLSD